MQNLFSWAVHCYHLLDWPKLANARWRPKQPLDRLDRWLNVCWPNPNCNPWRCHDVLAFQHSESWAWHNYLQLLRRFGLQLQALLVRFHLGDHFTLDHRACMVYYDGAPDKKEGRRLLKWLGCIRTGVNSYQSISHSLGSSKKYYKSKSIAKKLKK